MKNKLLFYLNADFTHFAIAYFLQQKYDCEIYAIIDITDKPKEFFLKQKLVNFKKTWFFHDQIKKEHFQPDFDYLKKIEKKYKVNLWQLVQNERIFLYYKNFHKFSNDEILNILEQECRFLEDTLEHRGISNPNAATKTDIGIAFLNKYGAFLYLFTFLFYIPTSYILNYYFKAIHD